jgi:peptide/nickel transport system substrate-binding protein
MKFDYWNRGEEVRLSAYDNHFDPIDYDGRIDRWVPSVDTALAQLEQGEADLISEYTGDPTVLQDVVDNNDSLSMATATNVAPQYIVHNNDYPPGQIDGFRRALSHRLDKETIVNDIFNGWGEPASEHLTSPGLGFWYNDDLEPFSYDLQAAANKLVDAGFLWDEEENRVWIPEDELTLSQEEVAPAEEAGFNRDFVKE